jgi:hypothetical protein
MFKLFTIVSFISLAFATSAFATPIFPPQVGGVFTSRILASDVTLDANGDPLDPATASVAMVLEDGTQLVCAVVSPGETVSVDYTVPNNNGRQKASAVAYSSNDCGVSGVDVPSDNSENTAFMFFNGPGKPTLSN